MRYYSQTIYSKEVLLKSAYSFTDECYIHLDIEGSNYVVELIPKNGVDSEQYYLKFENELVAQETRKIVAEKTKEIREMIVARSLSSTIINNSVEEVTNEEDFSADEILKDWFDNGEE